MAEEGRGRRIPEAYWLPVRLQEQPETLLQGTMMKNSRAGHAVSSVLVLVQVSRPYTWTHATHILQSHTIHVHMGHPNTQSETEMFIRRKEGLT